MFSGTRFLSGVGMTVLSLMEMYVSLLRLGLEQVDWGESSQPGRLSATLLPQGGEDPVQSPLGKDVWLGEEWMRGDVDGLK